MTASFYYEPAGDRLRFGDVLSGYVLGSLRQRDTVAQIEKAPGCPVAKLPPLFTVELTIPTFCVLLTPCCSMIKRAPVPFLALSPLRPVLNYWLQTPYLAKDFTRVNRRGMPNLMNPPDIWAGKSVERQVEELAEGPSYAYLENFVYDGNQHFPSYSLTSPDGNVSTKCYMVDFREVYLLSCESIRKEKEEILFPRDSKVLQLTARVRTEMRFKMAHFFLRPAPEDLDEDPEVAMMLHDFEYGVSS